ncbi:hypothetical protein Tco_1467172 [Tanacetum coccineum]
MALHIARGKDEVELTDEESSDSDEEDEVAEIFRIKTNVFDSRHLHVELSRNEEPTPVENYYEPFSYKNGCSEWPTCSWRDDGYCHRGNLPESYIVGNALHYQDFEWYEALEDSKLKEEALKNKATMEGIIEDEDDESSNEGWKRWNVYENTNSDHEEREYEMKHKDEERCELFQNQKRPVCNIRRFEMIKYSFREDVAVKESEYDDLTSTSKDACRTYQEIFRIMDEGWMDLTRKKSTMLVKYLQAGILAHKINMKNLPSKYQGSFSF